MGSTFKVTSIAAPFSASQTFLCEYRHGTSDEMVIT